MPLPPPPPFIAVPPSLCDLPSYALSSPPPSYRTARIMGLRGASHVAWSAASQKFPDAPETQC